MKTDLLKVLGLGSIAGAMFGGVAVLDMQSPATTEEVSRNVVDTEASLAGGMTCNAALAQDDTAVLASAQAQVADCMYVGCGGIF
jgi:hypothetical protein